jgi:ergothioneine biosynthesis protein EgtB
MAVHAGAAAEDAKGATSGRYRAVRAFTEKLLEPLSPEDCMVQSMPDASPVRWHIAHTTWFFETFVLAGAIPSYEPFDPAYLYLFNSYYNRVGDQFPRPQRGTQSRPSLAEVRAYRREVDARMEQLFASARLTPELASIVEIGLNHEQQHQELVLTDIRHALAQNPTWPAYQTDLDASSRHQEVNESNELDWIAFDEGVYEVGFVGDGFSFDNESPRHRVFLEPFALAGRLATNAEYLNFVEDGGYRRPELWLSEAWATVQEQGWSAPLYWVRNGGQWREFTLGGLVRLEPRRPVSSISYFEADAFARWAGARLPTEFEWESACQGLSIEGNFVESDALHPQPNPGAKGLEQMFGDVWEWTSSSYGPYPGFRASDDALGEYNGKFMCNQYVLRGGSCATSESHIRATYRNFFPASARWQFSGVRMARTI